MNRDHESLDLDDLYIQSTQMLQDGLSSMKKQIRVVKNFIEKEKVEVLKLQRNSTRENDEFLKIKEKFFNHALKEVSKLEYNCEDCHTHLGVDAAEEVIKRMEPPSHTSLKEIEKSSKKCNKSKYFENEKPNSSCRKEWINIFESELDSTEDIEEKGKIMMPSSFDNSDLKFKQEMNFLRMKMFTLPSNFLEKSEFLQDDRRIHKDFSKPDFIETLNKTDSFIQPKIAEIGTLKFIKGKPKIPKSWGKFLDGQGNQLMTKWYLLISPQIEKILTKRSVPLACFNPQKTLQFLMKIPENGINFILNREDLRPLLDNSEEAWPWIEKWKLQFKSISGHEIAATLIQAYWRGFWIRKKVHESECKYIAASLIWHAWLVFKTRRHMHDQYLMKLQTSLVEAENLTLQLSKEYDDLIKKPYVVIHLSSLGFLRDIRKTFPARSFPHEQNTLDLKLSHLRNPNAVVIYILPVKLKQKLVDKYYDIIDTIFPNREDMKNRLIFVELSQSKLFQTGSFNVSRSLYFSDQSFSRVKEEIKGKPSFFLPWVMDECDVILSDSYKIPLLAPSLKYQKDLRNKSYFLEMINSLELQQPPYKTNIKNYQTLCNKLAELICLHTEVCSWLIKLNVGTSKHVCIFLVNHLSVPFMPILRRERKNHSEENWRECPELREDYFVSLKDLLPGVVSKSIRLPKFYKDWKEFEAHMVKYGVVIQATLKEKSMNIVTISLFIPGKASGKKPRWTGTADKHILDSSDGCLLYMVPQNSVEVHEIEPTVSKLSGTLHDNGYFGYVTFDFYCYRKRHDDKMQLFVIEIHPHYGHVQQFIDWVNFAIQGSYNKTENTMDSNVVIVNDKYERRSHKDHLSYESPNWNETMERYAIGFAPLRHSAFSFFQWPKLKKLAEDCDIKFNPETKEGSHLIPITGDHNKRVMYTSIGTAMKPIIAKVEKHLKNLQNILSITAKKKKKSDESNLKLMIDFFVQMYLDFENVSLEKCVTDYNPL